MLNMGNAHQQITSYIIQHALRFERVILFSLNERQLWWIFRICSAETVRKRWICCVEIRLIDLLQIHWLRILILFAPLKEFLKRQKFSSDVAIQDTVYDWFKPNISSPMASRRLHKQWDACLNAMGSDRHPIVCCKFNWYVCCKLKKNFFLFYFVLCFYLFIFCFLELSNGFYVNTSYIFV